MADPATDAAKNRLVNALRKAEEVHRKAAEALQKADDARTVAVAACRAGGVPWYPIAAVLGKSETSTVAKYKRKLEALTPPAKAARARKS